MKKLVLGISVFLLVGLSIADEDYYSYSYQYEEDDDSYEPPEENGNCTHGSSSGNRLVGALRADIRQLNFLVGFNTHGREFSTGCTGSLITSRWVLSAAHCITNYIPREDNHLRKCLAATKAKGKYKAQILNELGEVIRKPKAKCIMQRNRDIKIYPLKPRWLAFLGIADVNNQESHQDGKKIEIEYFVRHHHTYRGGGIYGTHGGYDITLLHLKEPAQFTPACLPQPSFKDSGIGKSFPGTGRIELAGFGMYFRLDEVHKSVCMTDAHGASKFHYCSPNSRCEMNRPPPQEKQCKHFFAQPDTPDEVPRGYDEVILTEQGREDIYCYPEYSRSDTSEGWCKVEDDASQMQKLKETDSWGFCSKDCNLKPDAASSVLRHIKSVDILEDRMCNTFLKAALSVKPKVMPRILCIGHLETFKFQHWARRQDGSYVQSSRKIYHKEEFEPGTGQYVRAAGTCKGDSGGPVFTESPDGRFVVLGAVSGGRGRLGKCGGMNNPTHYARVKYFGRWIKATLSEDSQELCWKG